MYTTVKTTLRPGSTIEGLIRHYNSYDIEKEQLQELVQKFNELNPHARPPKLYQEVEVPIACFIELSKKTTHKYRKGESEWKKQ